MKPLKERLLGGVFRIARYYAWWVLFVCLLLVGVGVFYARDVPLRSSFLDLLPTNDPVIDEYRENEQYYAQSDYVALLLTLTGEVAEEDREAVLLAAAEVIAASLREDPEFVEVTYLREVSPEIPDQYLNLFQLGQEELARIEGSVKLARASIAGRTGLSLAPNEPVGAVYERISRGMSDAFASALLRQDRGGGLSAVPELAGQLTSVTVLNNGVLQAIDGLAGLAPVTEAVLDLAGIFTPTLAVDSRDPTAFFSRDRTRLVMTVRPRDSSQRGVVYNTLVTEKLRQGIERADPPALGVRVGITGTYSFSAGTNAVINADMLRTTIISSIGVFVIFLLAFGSVFYSIIAVIPLLISVVLTICWAKLAVGGFNLVTTFLPALVLGLGIDYAIHLISRYAEERSAGRSLNRALYTAILRKGEASFFAAATTSLVFVGLLSARSRALFEMGAITSVGVMAAFLVTLFLLPALITLSHYLLHVRHRETVVNYAERLSGLFRFVTGRGRAICVIVLILTFFVAFQASRIAFVFSSTDLVPRLESQDVMDEILTHFDVSPTGIGSFFVFYASTATELREVVDRLSENDLVEVIDSAVGILPVNLTEQQQTLNELDIGGYVEQLGLLERSFTERSAVLAQIRALLAQFALLQYAASLNGEVEAALKANEILAQLREIQMRLSALDLDWARERVSSLRIALEALDANLQQLRDLPPVETLLRDILNAYPEGIRSRYLTPDGEFVVQARVNRRIFDAENLAEFDRFAASFSEDYFGMPLAAKRLEELMKRDFYLSTLLAILLIVVVLWRSLHGWVRALLAASPLLLGYVWMLGGMRLFSIDFNFLSITISPLLIGIGVDSGIHVLHRTMEERQTQLEGAIERGVTATSVAVLVTSLTTMLVFGSLLAARTPGLHMLGVSALLGIGFSLLFTLLFLPAALRVEGGKRV